MIVKRRTIFARDKKRNNPAILFNDFSMFKKFGGF